MRPLRLITVNALALMFLLLQQATVVHAAEHDFHASEVACDIFIVADKQKVDESAPSLDIIFVVSGDELSNSFDTPAYSRGLSVYRSRAPPVYFS